MCDFGVSCFHSGHSHYGPALRLPLRINLIADVDTSNELWIGSHLMCILWQWFVLSFVFSGLVCFPLSKQNVIKLGSTTLIPLPSAPIFLFPINLITENVEVNRSGRGKMHLARRLGSEVLGSPLQGQRTDSVWEVGVGIEWSRLNKNWVCASVHKGGLGGQVPKFRGRDDSHSFELS